MVVNWNTFRDGKNLVPIVTRRSTSACTPSTCRRMIPVISVLAALSYYRAPVFFLLLTGEPSRAGTSQPSAHARLHRYNFPVFATAIPFPAGFCR